MPIEITMPKFGLTMQEGTLQRCFKAAGDHVQAGEPLYEVETEKVLYVVEAPEAGTLAIWLHEEGAVVECGHLVAVLARSDEDVTAVQNRYSGERAAIGDGKKKRPEKATDVSLADAPVDRGQVQATPTLEGRRAVSPIARKLAAELGVELGRVVGTG